MDPGFALFAAVDGGDVAAAEKLLASNPDAIDARVHGATALHRAAARGELALIELLIERGADLEALDDSGATALSWASGEDRDEAVDLLLGKGAGANAVELAARGLVPRLAQVLDESPWMLEQRNTQGTPLHAAVRRGRIGAVELLLERGASLSERNDDGWTPLELARESGQPEVANLIEEFSRRTADSGDCGAASVLETVSYRCGACSEEIVIEVDRTQGDQQQLVEDCPVCCHPNVIDVSLQRGSGGEARAELE